MPPTPKDSPAQTSAPSEHPTKSEYPLRMRGVLTVLNEANDCEFRAQRTTGESTQKVISKSGDAKLYQTIGKKPMMVAHLTTRADSSDPVADLYQQLDAIAAKQSSKPKAKPRKRDRQLLNEEHAQVYLSQKERMVQMQLSIDLTKTPDYQNELIKLMQKISQCFLINQVFLRPPKS